MLKTRWLLVLGMSFGAASLSGCGDCSDEAKAASAFLEDRANLTCQTDADCVVVSTGCARPARSLCGQAALSKAAANSEKWQHLQSDLTNCESNCDVCAAALLPKCSEGFCGGPP